MLLHLETSEKPEASFCMTGTTVFCFLKDILSFPLEVVEAVRWHIARISEHENHET